MLKSTNTDVTFSAAEKTIGDEKISLKFSPPRRQSSLDRRRPNLATEFQPHVRPDEVVMAAKQLQMIFETLLPSRVTSSAEKDRPSLVGS
jgi:hypothetical protein